LQRAFDEHRVKVAKLATTQRQPTSVYHQQCTTKEETPIKNRKRTSLKVSQHSNDMKVNELKRVPSSDVLGKVVQQPNTLRSRMPFSSAVVRNLFALLLLHFFRRHHHRIQSTLAHNNYWLVWRSNSLICTRCLLVLNCHAFNYYFAGITSCWSKCTVMGYCQ
jgi:hypothetical protein